MSWFLTMLFPESVPPGLADEARSRGLRLVTGAQLPVLVREMFGGVRSLDAVTLVTTASLEDVSDEVLLPPVEPFDWDAQLKASTASLQRVAGLLETAVLRAGSVEVVVHDGYCLPEDFIRVDASPSGLGACGPELCAARGVQACVGAHSSAGPVTTGERRAARHAVV